MATGLPVAIVICGRFGLAASYNLFRSPQKHHRRVPGWLGAGVG